MDARARTATRTLRIDIDADGIALITLDDPARSMNVTSPELVADLMTAVERVSRDSDIRGAILTSGKDKGFAAGGDIKDFVTAHDRGMTEDEAFEISNRWNVDLRRIERGGKPIVAALNGLALGGGLELALCCHHRVLVDDPRAIVGLVEVTIGLLPAGGGSQRLPRLIGIERALPLMLEGRRLQPAEALALGIVDRVVPKERLLSAAREWVLEHPHAQQPWDIEGFQLPGGTGPLAPHANRTWMLGMARELQRSQGNYPAPLALMSAVYEGTQLPIDLGLRIESKYSAKLLPGAVARNLMRTCFVNRGRASRPDTSARRCAERVSAAYVDEGQRMVEEGVAPALIENAARFAGMAAGPLALADHRSRESVPPNAAQPDAADVKQRLLYIQALEGARCLEEGVVADPADADVASVYGAGFPGWTGGALSFVETVGLREFVAECQHLAGRYGPRFEPPPGLRERARQGLKFYKPPIA
jgi:3-hydroxyacyl-CoA dehydrogenase/enoyl-CoA hydratase/3-hydroxybutyryl-CoA epimerase